MNFVQKVIVYEKRINEKYLDWRPLLMSKEKYNEAFKIAFEIEESQLGSELKYESIQEWDSIGHMSLIAELEDTFEISMEMDDIIDFSSYDKGIELLKKYDITI